MPFGQNNTPELEAAASARAAAEAEQINQPINSDEFKLIQGKVKRLADAWKAEEDETEIRRRLRHMQINVNQKRASGEFKPDEIYIPIHVINDNITKEQAQYIAYLTSSRNAAIFKCKQAIAEDMPMEPVEKYFTNLVRYPGWEIPLFRLIDGTQTHGWDSLEIIFDPANPGHFGLKHNKHENVWFPKDIEYLQQSPIVAINCKCSREQLKSIPEINEVELSKLFDDREENKDANEALVCVQKVFYRKDGIVYVCWLNHVKNIDFLREPRPLWLGKKHLVIDSLTGVVVQTPKVYETLYPLEILPYIISEDSKIVSTKGRVCFDEYIQEAASSLVSSIVNAWHRASQVMGAPKNPAMGGSIKQTDTIIQGGKFLNQPVDFFHMPYPDTGGMQIVEGLITQNKSETSQVNFAVNNREDSRKTAKEISAASQQAALLSGVQVTLLSIFLRNVYTQCWDIAQSQLIQGLLEDNTLDRKYYNLEYQLFSAGDTEVIQREETLQKLQAAWPVVAQTPAAMLVLKEILQLAFPSMADKFISALDQGAAQGAGLAQALGNVIQEIRKAHPEVFSPEDSMKLDQLLQASQQAGVGGQPNGNNPTQANNQANQQSAA